MEQEDLLWYNLVDAAKREGCCRSAARGCGGCGYLIFEWVSGSVKIMDERL